METDTINDEILVFPTRKRNYILKRSQIIYLENDGKKVILHTLVGRIELYASMNVLEDTLGYGFFRTHRGFLVNLSHILSYSRSGIFMTGGSEAFLARERYRGFVERYREFLGRGRQIRSAKSDSFDMEIDMGIHEG